MTSSRRWLTNRMVWPASAKRVQRAHEAHDLGPGQRRRGLVEHEHARVLAFLVLQGPHDGHHGLLGGRSARTERVGLSVGCRSDRAAPACAGAGRASWIDPPGRVSNPLPMARFSATDSAGNTAAFWCTKCRPSALAFSGVVWSERIDVSPTTIVPPGSPW